MQRNVPFRVVVASQSRPHGRPSTACTHQRERGLRNGRFADHLFRRIINRTQRLDPTDSRHYGVYNVMRLLRSHGIVITHVQVPVWDADLEIRTTLDGLGYTKHGVCVFELKTTTYSVQEHMARYRVCCTNNPTLSNGMGNTEKNMHALQTAFGMHCCKKRMTSTVPVQGVVVVACTDGAKLYWVDSKLAVGEAFSSNKQFNVSIPPTVHRRSYKRFLTLPTKDSLSYKQLIEALRQRGFSELNSVTTESLNCSGIASASTSRGTFKGIVGILSAQTAPSTRKTHVQMLKTDANKVYIESKKTAHVTPFIVLPGTNGFTVCQVASTIKPKF